MVLKGGMRSMPVVVVEEGGQMGGAHGGVLVSTGIGPFAEGGLDEAFGLAVGLGSVGAGEEVAQALATAALGKELGDVAGAVVAHDGFGFDAEGAEIAERGVEELDRAVLTFIGHDPSKRDPGSVIDRDMDVFPAGAPDQIAAVASDAVAGPLDARELFDVQVDELARALAFVAMDRRRRIEQGETVEMVAPQEPRDGGPGERRLARNLEPGQPVVAQRQDDGHLRGRGLPGTAVWPRGAIAQAADSFAAVTRDPLAHGALGETCLEGGRLRGELLLKDSLDHSRSTARGQAGMLMELHVWVGFEGLNVCTPISLSNPSPHEQPIETSHLVQCHAWNEG